MLSILAPAALFGITTSVYPDHDIGDIAPLEYAHWRERVREGQGTVLATVGFRRSALDPGLWSRVEGTTAIYVTIPTLVKQMMRVSLRYLNPGAERGWVYDMDKEFVQLVLGQRADNKTVFAAWEPGASK